MVPAPMAKDGKSHSTHYMPRAHGRSGELLEGIAETVFPVNHARNFSATADQGGRADHRDTGFVDYQTRKRQRAAAPASRFWAFMVTLWSPTTPQRWVSWAQLAILYLAITGDYPTHEGQTKRRRTMVAPPARGEGKLWSDMISTVRGIAVAAGKAFPWLMTSMCQRPTDTLRIVTTCTAWRIDPALIEQCDSVITNILPTTAVSSTAFRAPITREHTQNYDWPTLHQDEWPGQTWQSRLRRTIR